jgi:hypothetical protein
MWKLTPVLKPTGILRALMSLTVALLKVEDELAGYHPNVKTLAGKIGKPDVSNVRGKGLMPLTPIQHQSNLLAESLRRISEF